MNDQSPQRPRWSIPPDMLRSILKRQVAQSAGQTTTAALDALVAANAEPADVRCAAWAKADDVSANDGFKTRAEIDAELLRLRALLLPQPQE